MKLIDKSTQQVIAKIHNSNIPTKCYKYKHIVKELNTQKNILYDPELHYLEAETPYWHPLILMPNSIYLVTDNSQQVLEVRITLKNWKWPVVLQPIQDNLYGIYIDVPPDISAYTDFNVMVGNQSMTFNLEEWGLYGSVGTIFNSIFDSSTNITNVTDAESYSIKYNYMNSNYCNNRLDFSYCKYFIDQATSDNTVMPLDFIIYKSTPFTNGLDFMLAFQNFKIKLPGINKKYNIDTIIYNSICKITNSVGLNREPNYPTAQVQSPDVPIKPIINHKLSWTIPIQHVFDKFDYAWALAQGLDETGCIDPQLIFNLTKDPVDKKAWNYNNDSPWQKYPIEYMSIEGGNNIIMIPHKYLYDNIGDSQQFMTYYTRLNNVFYSRNMYTNNIFEGGLSIPSIINRTSSDDGPVANLHNYAQKFSNIILTNQYLKLPWGWIYEPALNNPYNINITNSKSSIDLIGLNTTLWGPDISFAAVYDSITTYNLTDHVLQAYLSSFYLLDTSLGMMSIKNLDQYFDPSYNYKDKFAVHNGFGKYAITQPWTFTQEIHKNTGFLTNKDNTLSYTPKLNMPINNKVLNNMDPPIPEPYSTSGWIYNGEGKTSDIFTATYDLYSNSVSYINIHNYHLIDNAKTVAPIITATNNMDVFKELDGNIKSKLYKWSVRDYPGRLFILAVMSEWDSKTFTNEGMPDVSGIDPSKSKSIIDYATANKFIDPSDTLVYRPDLSNGTGVTYYTTKYNPMDVDASYIHAKITYQWVDFAQQVSMRAFKFRLLTSEANFKDIMPGLSWHDASDGDIKIYKSKVDEYFVNMNKQVVNLHNTDSNRLQSAKNPGFAKLKNPILDNAGRSGQIAEPIDISWCIGLPPNAINTNYINIP